MFKITGNERRKWMRFFRLTQFWGTHTNTTRWTPRSINFTKWKSFEGHLKSRRKTGSSIKVHLRLRGFTCSSAKCTVHCISRCFACALKIWPRTNKPKNGCHSPRACELWEPTHRLSWVTGPMWRDCKRRPRTMKRLTSSSFTRQQLWPPSFGPATSAFSQVTPLFLRSWLLMATSTEFIHSWCSFETQLLGNSWRASKLVTLDRNSDTIRRIMDSARLTKCAFLESRCLWSTRKLRKMAHFL